MEGCRHKRDEEGGNGGVTEGGEHGKRGRKEGGERENKVGKLRLEKMTGGGVG